LKIAVHVQLCIFLVVGTVEITIYDDDYDDIVDRMKTVTETFILSDSLPDTFVGFSVVGLRPRSWCRRRLFVDSGVKWRSNFAHTSSRSSPHVSWRLGSSRLCYFLFCTV